MIYSIKKNGQSGERKVKKPMQLYAYYSCHYNDGENYKQTLTIYENVPAGGRAEFKKWLTNPRDEHPRTITVTIVDAW